MGNEVVISHGGRRREGHASNTNQIPRQGRVWLLGRVVGPNEGQLRCGLRGVIVLPHGRSIALWGSAWGDLGRPPFCL